MTKFEDVYNKVTLEIKYRNVNCKNIHGSIPTFEGGVIYEDVAFHKLPRKFSDELIKIIKDMKINKIPEKDIDLRSLFKLIKKSEVENFDQFFNFIQLLSNSSEKILTIKMGIECSYEEPIELIEFSNIEYQKIFHDKPYEDLLKKKIKNQCFSKSLEIMKNHIHELNNLGTLTINPNLIADQMFVYDSDDSIIGHEIRHFIIFLQRWSKANYEVCKVYSNQDIHEYDRNNPDFKSYSLHEDEFITLSATCIERLVNIFLKHKRNTKTSEINKLIKSILIKAGKYDINVLENDLYWYELLDEKTPQINSIILFFKNIFDDRKYKFDKNIRTKKDKFLTLLNWTYKSFYEKIEELRKN